MRLVTWNCNGALRLKHRLLDDLNADVLVVQECEDPAQSIASYRAWAGVHAWIGHSKNKGLGIFPRSGQSIERMNWLQEKGGLFIPLVIGVNLSVIGVWTLERKEANQYSYISQFWHYLQLNRHRLGPRTVICGDFNSNQIWDAGRRTRNHRDCVRELGEAGFRSLYHLATGEEQGHESQPTLYLHRSTHRPYHIDYVFAHQDMLGPSAPGVQVGCSADWITASDHMPLIVDLPDLD